jgi:hypothetical protein
MRFLIALALLASVDTAFADAIDNALPKDCDATADAGLSHSPSSPSRKPTRS